MTSDFFSILKKPSIFDPKKDKETGKMKEWTPTAHIPTKDAKTRFPKAKPPASADKEKVDKEIARRMEIAEKELARYPKGEEFYRNKIAELQLHFSEMSEMDAPENKAALEKKKKIQAETLEKSKQYRKTKTNFLDSWIASEEKKLTDPKWKGKHKEQEWGKPERNRKIGPRDNPISEYIEYEMTEKEKILQEKRTGFVFSGEEKDDVTFTVTRNLPAGIDYKPKKDYVGTKVPEEIVKETVSSRSLYKKLEAWFENNKARRIEVIDKTMLDAIERRSKKTTSGLRRKDTTKQNFRKLQKLRKYTKIVDSFAELRALKGRYTPPKKTDAPKEITKKSYYDWLLKYLLNEEGKQLKQVRKDLHKHGISLDEVKDTWEGVKNHHRTLIKQIKTLQRQTSILGKEHGDSGKELERLQGVLETLMASANKNKEGEGRSTSLAGKPKHVILREMLSAKARGDQYEPAYKILIQSYLKGGKLESYLNAIKRIKENWQPPVTKKGGKEYKSHQLAKLGLKREERQLLYDTTYGDNRQGWRILAEILKEKGIHVPKAYSAKTSGVWSKIESGGSEIKGLTNDMRELNRILESDDPQDDVEYITGEDSRQHIQSLLYVTERNYRNMEDGEEKDKLGIFYGKLAYLAKFINENREEGDKSPQVKVSSKMLQDQNMSYYALDEHFATLLSERVKTILENPENWGTLLESKETSRVEDLERRQEESAQRNRERLGTLEDWIEDMRQSVGDDPKIHRFKTEEEAEKRIKELTDALERNEEKRESQRYERASQHYGVYTDAGTDYDFKNLPIEGLQELDPETLDTMGTWLEEQMWDKKVKEREVAELRERTAGQPVKVPYNGRWITKEQYKEETGKEWKQPFTSSKRRGSE